MAGICIDSPRGGIAEPFNYVFVQPFFSRIFSLGRLGVHYRYRVTVLSFVICLAASAACAIEVSIPDVPAYNWYHGCGPTAGAMVFGYWDRHGFANLFDAAGSDLDLTSAVQDRISSPEHNAKYDPSPDRADLPDPPLTSLATFMNTSVDPRSYGGSYTTEIATGMRGYAASRAYAFEAQRQTMNYGLTWEGYTAEVDAGRPVLLYVDTNGSGSVNHAVAGIGYEDRGGDDFWYACYTTYSENESLAWKRFRPTGNAWGVGSATFVTPPDGYWRGGEGDWFDPAGWTNEAAPNPSPAVIDAGRVTLSSGTAEPSELTVGRWGEATLALEGGTLVIGEALRFGPLGRCDGAGGEIELRAADLLIDNPAPEALPGLAGSRLTAAGGTDESSTLEAAAVDMGAVAEGFAAGGSWGALEVGGASAGRLRLTDAVDQAADGQPDAVYAETVTLGEGSILEIDVTLYCRTFENLGGEVIEDGGRWIQVVDRGDFNGDGVANGLDIPMFKQALADSAAWESATRRSAVAAGDFNADAAFNGLDIPGFKSHLAQASTVPEPSVTMVLAAGVSGLMLRRRR